jgi:hypothetical protein
MPWKLRDDVRQDERCFVLTDAVGETLGYFQHFPDDSVGYWFERAAQARPARSPEDARDRLVERFLPLRIAMIEPDGTSHEYSEPFASSTAYAEVCDFTGKILEAARLNGGELSQGMACFGVDSRRQVASVRIIGTCGTILDDRPL